MKRLQLAILLIVLIFGLFLYASCYKTPQPIPSPVEIQETKNIPLTNNPAGISAQVTIADQVITESTKNQRFSMKPLGQDRVWWIVDVSAKNNSYMYPINSFYDKSVPLPNGIYPNMIWSIIWNGNKWSGLDNIDLFPPPSMSIQKGQIGKTTFLFEMFKSVKPQDAKICYRGQEPFSYNTIVDRDRVPGYDWTAKKPTSETEPSGTASAKTELYFAGDPVIRERFVNLRTIQSWAGTDSRFIPIQIDKSPWVLNYKSNTTSRIGSQCYVMVWNGMYNGNSSAISENLPFKNVAYDPLRDVECITVHKTGQFTIEVKASGCNWWVKVGIE